MKWLKILVGVFVGLLLCVFLLIGAWVYWFVYRDLPSIYELKNLDSTQLSKVIASDGTAIGYFPQDGRIVLNGKNLPPLFKQAFISAEDSDFYRHAGLDFTRIVGALIADIRANSYVQGASTITQQVVRSYLLTREKTISRKLKEIVLAMRIERTLTKDQIIDLYLDRLYLGSGAYGVGAAALRYFDKECKDLTLSEMSMIAGLAPAPARYSPLNDFQAAKRRQHYVLTRMIEEGYINDAEASAAYKQPLKIKGEAVALFTRYPYVTEYVRVLITQRYGEEILPKGIRIQTSISPRLQDAATMAVRKGAVELEMKKGEYRGPLEGTSPDQGDRLLALQQNQLAWQGPRFYQLYWGRVKTASPLTVDIGGRNVELGPEAYAWVNPKGAWHPSKVLKSGDLVRLCSTPDGFILLHDLKVQAALVAFDLETSGVLALVGGTDYSQSQFNRAVDARRQSGSAIKPFIYAAALDKGYTPSTILFDTPITFQSREEAAWSPKNYENEFYGATTLRKGLVLSRNVVTVKILKDIGIDYALSYLRQFEMGKDYPRDLSLALGSGVVVPYDLFRGYATFATYGLMFEPVLIQSISQAGEGIIFNAASTAMPDGDLTIERRVISEQTAYIITNILTDAVQHGTGWKAKQLGRPVAGKTGTSDNNRDAWFVGYTPDVLCGVWTGYDDNMVSLGGSETGGSVACPIFTDFMQSALSSIPVKDFRVPDGIVFAKIDTKTGKLTNEESPDVRFECYKADMVPEKQEEESPSADDLMLKEIY